MRATHKTVKKGSPREPGGRPNPLKVVTAKEPALITGCILALNEEQRMKGAIQSLAGLADQIIVIDNGSTDSTVEIAIRLGAKILNAPRAANFDAIRNLAIEEADSDWIFYLDADERNPAGLARVLRDLIASHGDEFAAVCVPFKHYFCGKWIQHSGWWPGYTRPQLLRRGKFTYNTRLHSGVSVTGETIYLSADNPDLAIDHYSYDDLTHYLAKLNNYTDGEAESLLADGGSHAWQAQMANFVADWQTYYERGRAYRDGMHGFVLSFFSAFYRFASRAKLWDMRRSQGKLIGEDPVPSSIPETLEFMARVAQEGSEPWCAASYPEAPKSPSRISPDWYTGSSPSTSQPASRKRAVYPPSARIVGCILARNEGARIELALRSLVEWVDRIIVIDNDSDDNTAEIARMFTAHVIHAPRTADQQFDGLRNLAIEQAEMAEADWLFFLDADEIVSQGLGEAIRRLVVERGTEFEAISFPLQNWFYGKWMQCPVWWPGYCGPRLLKRGAFHFGERLHAGAIVSDGARVMEFPADNPELSIRHNAYDDIRSYISKMNLYTTGEAVYMDRAEQPCTWQAMLAHFVHEWRVHYDQLRGRDDGMHGFVQSFLCAFYQFTARAKLWDLRCKRGEIAVDEPVPASLREMLEFMARVSVEGPSKWLQPVPKLMPVDHVPLLWQGPLLDASGCADDGRSLVFGMIKAGEPIWLVPERWGENLADINEDHAELMRIRAVPENTPADLLVLNTLPWLVERKANARFQIARTVFESDRLSSAWVHRLNSMDRIWVASEFNRQTFAESGVDPAKIAVIPEALDAELFGAECEPLPLNFGGSFGLVPSAADAASTAAAHDFRDGAKVSLRGADERAAEDTTSATPPFRFLSIFDWMLHKGQDILLEAFAQEFGDRPDVELVIKTWSSNHYAFETIIEQANSMLLQRTGKQLNEYPNIHIFQRHLSVNDMPRLYKACDCFVLPTRGDGWQRPLMEAMAVGLPAISTSWSGHTQYFNSQVGYPVKYTLVPVSDAAAREVPVYGGHCWAEPNIADLRRHMRYVESHRIAARKEGAAARKSVLECYSRPSVAAIAREEVALCRKLAAARPWPALLTRKPAAPRIEQRMRRPKSHPVPLDPPPIVDYIAHLGRKLRVRWEGDQDPVSSLAHVNREFCLGLIGRGDVELSLPPGSSFCAFAPEDAARFAPLLACMGVELSGPPDVTVRHHWPPKWDRPENGKLIVMQPWELSHLPDVGWVEGASGADEVWVYSRFVRDIYVRSGVPAEKVRVVPLGVRPEVFTPLGDEFPLPMHPTSGKRPFRFLYVGGTVDRKGADTLLQTFLRTFTRESDVCLVVKDMGVNTFYRGQNFGYLFRQAAADVKMPMVVYLDSDFSEAEMAALYRACDCVVLPARGEGFGLSPLEGLACGLPAIVTAGGPSEDYLSDEMALRVPHHRRFREGLYRGPGAFPTAPWDLEVDVNALSQAFHHINDDRAGARMRGAAGRTHVAKGWSWDRAIRIASERMLEIVVPTRDRPAPSTRLWTGMKTRRAGVAAAVSGSSSKHSPQMSERSYGARPRLSAGRRGTKGNRLSLVMIVRDEESRIRGCLESISPYVDEIIVIDTGSIDRTREIARECGALVYERPWTDSFSDARNAGLDLATGDWIFWMDADDIITPECGAMLRELINRHPGKDAAYQVQVRIPAGPDEFSETIVDHVKLFPNRPEFRFEHRIHEQILPALRKAKIDVRFSDAYVTHQNYDRSAEGQFKKRIRDFRLLYYDLQDHPDHPFVLFNLGMTYLYARKDYEIAAHYLWRSLKGSDWRDSIVRKAYALLTTARICQEEWDLAITANEAGRAHYPDDAELLFQAGQIYQQLGRHSEARQSLERLLSGSDDEHYRSVDVSLRTYRGSHEKALLHRRLGDGPHCEQILREICAAYPDYIPAWQDLLETLMMMGRESDARMLLSTLPSSESSARVPHPTYASTGGSEENSATQLEPETPCSVTDGSVGFINDCLVRARITLPSPPLRAERCVATVASPGYEPMLDCFLESLRSAGRCDDALIVVFVINGNEACRRVVAKYGARGVECTSLAPMDATQKAIMYSAAHVVDANSFICMDADMVVTGDLSSLFTSLEVCRDDSILVCKDAGLNQPTLGGELRGYYRGNIEDIAALLGGSNGEENYPFLVNDGLFAANRAGMKALDSSLRAMLPRSLAWVDGLPDHGCRNQFLFNLVLAKLKCAVELDAAYNLQLHMRNGDLQRIINSPSPVLDGRPIRVLHYCGPARAYHPAFQASRTVNAI